ncbi:MAG: sodium ion-translocating decarboxylase subunit beta, partial [Bacteroidales bacterium]|nr:sodium ion-translocating decarboxylase subunit beta [Bacteroidales bacterium]
MGQIFDSLQQFWQFTGFANCQWQNLVMIAIGIFFITIAILKEWEPLLLVPIGFGMIIGNIPMFPGLNIGIYEDGSVLNTLYQGVRMGWYPPLI